MPKVINQLIVDHMRIERVLTCMDEQIRRYASDSDEKPELAVIRDAIEYIRAYPDCHHHPLEERILDKLMNKIGDIKILRNLRQIKSEHAVLAKMTERLASDIDAISHDQAVPWEELEEAFANYYDFQSAHLNHENEFFFPLIGTYLSEAQLQELLEESGPKTDPLFEQHKAQFKELYDHIVESEERD